MAANFASKLALTQKQKQTEVMRALLREHGPKFYEYDLAARANLQEEKYAELFLQKPKPEPTPSEIEHAKASIVTLRKAPNEEATNDDNIAISIPVESDITPSKEFEDTAATKLPTSSEDAVSAEEQFEDNDNREEAHETFSLNIVLNEKQQLAAEYADSGKCFVLTGAAGTGKTTACREVAKRLLNSGKLQKHDFKIRGGGGRVWSHSIAFCAYTNRASDNMGRALHKDPELEEQLNVNVCTIHALLEYEPEFFAREDGTTGMRFVPKRDRHRPLRVTHLVIEESSMLGIDLWLKLYDALLPGTQIIFVGDINQLPPIFSKSILNYALVTLPVVELDEVYRQALDSPIISNAHHVLKGEALAQAKPNFMLIQKPDLKKIPSEASCVHLLMNSLQKWLDTPEEDNPDKMRYIPEEDIVLSPFNKQECGTINLNNHIAQFLGKRRNALVWEIFAGIRKLYLAVGDRVMVDKQDGIIEEIGHNGNYMGRMPRPASNELTRFGVMLVGSSNNREDEDFDLMMEGYDKIDIDAIPDAEGDEEAMKRQASHFVKVKLDSGREVFLRTAGDFGDNVFSLGYALTVHKAQGCEWRKVIILLHRNHAVLLNRELIYTAVTRAREYCIIVDLCNTIVNAIKNQKIKGNSVTDKIEWFNSEVSLEEPVPVIP